MKLFNFLEKWLEDKNKTFSSNSIEVIFSELWIYKLALNVASQRIGALISKCEFKTYIDGKSIKVNSWYDFNVKPNPNQTAVTFKNQLIDRLIKNQEVLVIKLDTGYYISSSFEKDDNQTKKTRFKNVTINIYEEEDIKINYYNKCIYIRYINSDLNDILKKMAFTYGELVDNLKNIQKNKLKYKLKIDQTASAEHGIEKKISDIINKDFETFVKNDNVIFPVYNGMDLDDMSSMANAGQNANLANKSLNEQVKQIFENVGKAMNIPSSIMNGTFEENDMDKFLTFSIDYFSTLLSESFTDLEFNKGQVIKGCKIYVDTKKIQHIDVIKDASSIDKLVSSGVYNIDEARELMNEDPVGGEIGKTRFITRNYAEIGSYLEEERKKSEVEKNGKNV